MTEASDQPSRPAFAEEIARFAAAAQDWVRQSVFHEAPAHEAPAHEAPAHEAPGDGAPGHGAPGHGADCQWCPLCRVVHAVREESPELAEQVTARLAEAGGAVAAAVRAVAEAAGAWAAGRQTAPTADTGPHVQRIDLDEPRDET